VYISAPLEPLPCIFDSNDHDGLAYSQSWILEFESEEHARELGSIGGGWILRDYLSSFAINCVQAGFQTTLQNPLFLG